MPVRSLPGVVVALDFAGLSGATTMHCLYTLHIVAITCPSCSARIGQGDCISLCSGLRRLPQCECIVPFELLDL